MILDENFHENMIINNYKLIVKVGRGAFSVVFKGIHIPTEKYVSIKIISKKSFSNELYNKIVLNEIEIHRNLNHPLITKFYESFEDELYTYISTEYVENGTVLSYVNRFGELPEDLAKHFFVQLIIALRYLHNVPANGIYHCDIKPENVLIDEYYNIRLIDFGLSHRIPTDTTKKIDIRSSLNYIPPEIIKKNGFHRASDVWCCGIFLSSILNGCLPFSDERIDRLEQKIMFSLPNFTVNLSDNAKDLVFLLLKKDFEERISLNKIFDHPWIKSYKKYSILDTIDKINYTVGDTVDEKIINAEKIKLHIKNAFDGSLSNITLHKNSDGDINVENIFLLRRITEQRNRKQHQSLSLNKISIPTKTHPGKLILTPVTKIRKSTTIVSNLNSKRLTKQNITKK